MDTQIAVVTAAIPKSAHNDQEIGRIPSIDDAGLLDALPYLALYLAHAQQDLMRRLFEIIQLSVRLHQESDDVTIKISLPADMLPQVAEAAQRIENTMPTTQRLPHERAAECVEVYVPPTGFEPVLPP
jgi:site-specific DNA recombinase